MTGTATGKVLVVEDNVETAQIVTLLLGLEGIFVINASDGLEGLSLAQAGRPQVIVTDLMMPHLDGIEMIKRLRTIAEFKGVPILAFTAYSEQATAAIQAGADGVIAKTEDLDKLVQSVKALLRPSEPG